MRLLSCLLSLAICSALAGCGMGVIDQNPVNTFPMVDIAGKVHGGQQPIVGAHVYLYAAGSTGYGTGATSLLNQPGYVTTQSDGSFSLNGAYSLAACQTAHQQVYLIAVGGNPGAGTNNNSVLMSALGDCANLTSGTFVWMNEVTTVASVYALQQFMTPGTYNVGTSSTNLIGLQNAFLAVPNLVSTTTGVANRLIPAKNGLAPQSEVNTLANILAYCVNSTTDSAPCTALFAAATPPGGIVPTDTLGAILDIALNPVNNAATLYNLPPPAIAFAPALTSQPTDWTVGFYFAEALPYVQAQGIAVDKSGSLWISNSYGGVAEFNPAGVPIPANPSLAANLPPPNYQEEQITIAPNGNLWVTTGLSGTAYLFTGTGTFLNSYSLGLGCGTYQPVSDANGTLYSPYGYLCSVTQNGASAQNQNLFSYESVALDANGHLWMTSAGPGILETTTAGNLLPSEPIAGWPTAPETDSSNSTRVAIDAQGDAWVSYRLFHSSGSAYYSYGVVEASPSGATLIGGNGIALPSSAGGVSPIAVDGADTIWVANFNGTLSHISNSGSVISPASGFQAWYPNVSVSAMALDSSGNVWAVDKYSNYFYEWIGVAAPVVTPLAQNLANSPTTIGQRP